MSSLYITFYTLSNVRLIRQDILCHNSLITENIFLCFLWGGGGLAHCTRQTHRSYSFLLYITLTSKLFHRFEWQGNPSLHPRPDEYGGFASVRLPVPDLQPVLHRESTFPWVSPEATQPYPTQQGKEVSWDDLFIWLKRRRGCWLIQWIRT